VGKPHCPICGRPIARQSPQQIVDRVMELDEGTRFQVLAPVVRGRKGEYGEMLRELQAKGFSRARVDGVIIRLDSVGAGGGAPGDLPALRSATVALLLARQAATGAGLAVPVHAGRRGHPLLIAARLIPEIERLDPARGLRHLLDLHPGELFTVETDDPGCIADVDTPEDYERLRG